MSDITIYHNARCSNSRGALELLRERGIEPTIVDYIKEPLGVAELTALAARLGVPVRELLRSKEAIYQELNLDAPSVSDRQLIEAVAAHPVLLNRPIVVSPKGARLCRPPQLVLDLL
ncbi:arsenate reductase (glutaredoxin) [Alicycliphilus denitrificans]|uniref:Arsenate reductase n=2 Tax=Alicycliphilus denitrificans TaxID=179636 RepID=F4GFY2_ALIDK|nr:arsenate reductase (glutaredoxin) [Alicycliphilus denitrificans]AEB86218.1 arsenate reductase [Alicycliphilus denitrificans K601]QKD45402.1 arsenate reductase (glutaredoxin) [Alicycliphilus denitrificans]GAO24887.1 arsenate reductase [Alicycliphilus sp. B1]